MILLPSEVIIMILEYLPFKESKKLYNILKCDIPTKIIKDHFSSNVLHELKSKKAMYIGGGAYAYVFRYSSDGIIYAGCYGR